MGFLAVLGRINAAHPWSHNDAYAGFVMRQARAVRRRGGDTVVDVGCGTGNLLARLLKVFPKAIGIEPDPDSAAAAVEQLCTSAAAEVQIRKFGGEPTHAYDLIVFAASLHHMPLKAALEDARAALRPGGRVVIIGVARETSDDALRSWISLLLNPLIGLIRHPTLATAPPAHMRAPTAEASESFNEIRVVATEVLPGIRMHRSMSSCVESLGSGFDCFFG